MEHHRTILTALSEAMPTPFFPTTSLRRTKEKFGFLKSETRGERSNILVHGLILQDFGLRIIETRSKRLLDMLLTTTKEFFISIFLLIEVASLKLQLTRTLEIGTLTIF